MPRVPFGSMGSGSPAWPTELWAQSCTVPCSGVHKRLRRCRGRRGNALKSLARAGCFVPIQKLTHPAGSGLKFLGLQRNLLVIYLVRPFLLSRSVGKEQPRRWRIPSYAWFYQASSDLSLERVKKRKYFPFQKSVDKQCCFRRGRKAADRIIALDPAGQKHALFFIQ